MSRETIRYPFPPQITRIMKRINSRKRIVTVVRTAPHSMRLQSYWDGGSKDEYTAFSHTEIRLQIPVGGHPGFDGIAPEWTPNVGDILVEAGTSCGKPAAPCITFFE